jgi:2,3-bisphosphoglycerate-dependent phosphoglycerate mutase
MHTLVLIRHGQSQWNLAKKFTGWTDIDLTDKGVKEAKTAGQALNKHGYIFDLAYTSYLKRAINTLKFALQELDLCWIPEIKSWQLNERHYGSLQGQNKIETAKLHGDEQVHIWRRSYDVKPPLLTEIDPRNPQLEYKYSHLDAKQIPLGESLMNTYERVLPYWQKEIAPKIEADQRILICAHGNSLRALVKHLENLSSEEIVKVEIPTGKPLIYKLDQNLKLLDKFYL